MRIVVRGGAEVLKNGLKIDKKRVAPERVIEVAPRVFEIRPYRLESDASVLTRDGIAMPLGPRAVAVLRTLVERVNEYVPKAQIIQAVWPGVVVEEGNLPCKSRRSGAFSRQAAAAGGSRRSRGGVTASSVR